MKVVLMTALLTVMTLTNVMAQSVREAEELYSRRGEDVSFAAQAAEKYSALAESESDNVKKAELLVGASKSLYYVGTHTDSNLDKKKNHQEGLNIAVEARDLVADKADEAQKKAYALSLYWYGANLGKWAEANGVSSSLGKWPSLKSSMNTIRALGYKELEDYGSSRILGRAYYKLPWPLGSKKKAYSYLKEAVENTKNGHSVSVVGLNNLFFADVLVSVGKKDEAKKLLEDFVAADAATLNPARVPENKEEQEEAKQMLERL